MRKVHDLLEHGSFSGRKKKFFDCSLTKRVSLWKRKCRLEIKRQVSGDDGDVGEVNDVVDLTSVQILVDVQRLQERREVRSKTFSTFPPFTSHLVRQDELPELQVVSLQDGRAVQFGQRVPGPVNKKTLKKLIQERSSSSSSKTGPVIRRRTCSWCQTGPLEASLQHQITLDLLDLVQVVGPSVVDVVQEAGGDHGHHLQVCVITLQHSRLGAETRSELSFTGL